MSQNPNKQSFGFCGFGGGFEPVQRVEEPKHEMFNFGGGEYTTTYWQQMQQQVYQQQHHQQQIPQQQQMQSQHHKDIKLADMDSNIVTPTIEMDELIIKTEPPDDNMTVSNLMDTDNSNAFYRSSAMNSLHHFPSYQHIKEEPSTSQQQKSFNFPRRKLQTERSETLPICQRCKQVFLKKSSYMKHVRHSSCSILEYNFKCLICPMSFMSPEELQAHEHVHRANQFFCQKFCGKYFDTLDLCEAHEYMFHDSDMFVCNICLMTLDTRDELFAHKTQHRHLIRFDCPICRRWFTSPNELRRHRVESPFLCGRFFTEEKDSIQNPESYYNHIAMNENNYSLQDCNIGVIEATPTNCLSSNINRNQPALGNNHFPTTMTIKSEPLFDPPAYEAPHHTAPEAFYSNSYAPILPPPPSYNNAHHSFRHTPYNELRSPFEIMERRYSNNFNFSAPYTPATPAVNESDAICCVPHCNLRKSTSPTLQFFKFPKDMKYLKQWLHNMKLIYNHSASYEDYRICSLHFPKRVINLHSLCYWAVPTYHLGHEDTANIFQNRDQNYYAQPQCSLPGCDNQSEKTSLKYFNFPTNDLDTYVKWCENCRLQINSNEPRQLCSRHFEDQCFGKMRLKVWAVPTLNLGGFPRIHDNPHAPILEVKKCCLPHCRRKRSEDPTLSLYSFPKDELLLQRWCYNLKLNPLEYRGRFHKVCSAHFVKDVIGSIKLHSGAVPTINLGHNDTNIYNNEMFTMSSNLSKTSLYANSLSSSSSSGSTTNYETPDTCSLPSCKRNRYADNVSMHTMPGRPEMLEKWCHNLKMNSQRISKYFRICSVHFEPYCIGGCMRPFALPTLLLGHDDPDIHHNPKVIKKLHIRETCCVPTCRRNRERDKANLHRFPLHKPELLQKWLDNLRRPMPDGTRLFNDAICERHFEDRCIRSKRLERWALPTLELGHDEEVMPLPSEAEVEELYIKQMANSSHPQATECCVSSCQRSPKTDDVKLYAIPDDESMLNKWSHNLQQDLHALPTARICNLHFETHCIGKRLHPWAVPTLNMPPSSADVLFENPKEMKALSRVKLLGYAPRCCLPHCRKQRTDGKVQLFRFPSYSKSMLKKWCHNLQISVAVASSSHRRVCSAHFEPHVLTKRCPMPNSMPTLELNCPPGHKIYQNPERLKMAKLRTQRLCVIPSCRKSRVDGVQLFLYPHNRVLLRKWAYNTKQKAGDCSRGQMRVCSEHFESNCFGPVRLCPGAIPTLKLGHDDPNIFANNLPPLEDQEMQCAIVDCKRSRTVDGVKLFRFPLEDEDLLWKWCNNLKLNPVDCHKSRICNMHFESVCVGPRGLFRWAIPTMLLGHNDAELHLYLNPKPEDRVSTEQIFKCCVTQCGRSRKYDEAQLNSFPKTRERFYRWTHNLRLDLDFAEREKYRICNAHFELQCIGKQRLHIGAIPTVQLGHDSDDIFQVDASELQTWYGNKRPRLSTTNDSLQSVMCDFLVENDENKCCYPSCMATKSALRESYSMPKHAALLDLWCSRLKINKESLCADAKLCGLHFIELYEETTAAASHLMETHTDMNPDLQVLASDYEHCSSSSLTRSMQCTVPDCKATSLSGKDIKLYQFPYNRELSEKWCFNTGIELDEQRRHLHKVCTLHFEQHCLSDAQRLRPWAIPTLNLPAHEPHEKLYQNPDLIGLDRRHLGPQSSKCCVPSCVNHNSTLEMDSVKLFNFPTDSEQIDKWLHNLRSCVEREKCPLYKICTLHFEDHCMSKMARLRPWAVPTLELGDHDDELELYQNPNEASNVIETKPTPGDNPEAQLIGCKIKHTLDLIKCCVASCRKSRLQHGVRFFDFPTEQKMIKRWCFNLQLPLATPKKLQHICNQHFEKRCFANNKQLHAWSLPTLNLGQQLNLELYKNPKNSVAYGRHSRIGHYLPVCCVPGCGKRRTVDNNLRTFAFPRHENMLQQWCDILKLDVTESIRSSRVCENHFATEDRFKTKLKRGVLPTQNLPSEYATADETNLYPRSNSSIRQELHDLPREKIKSPLESVTPQPRKVKRCCIVSCRHNQRPSAGMGNVRLFAFPKPSQLLLRKWCHNTQQPFKKRLRLNICSVHFEPQALLHGKPRPWAIPTVHLGHQHPIYNNPTTTTEKERCCITDCRATASIQQLLSFPKRSTLLRKWAHNTKQDAYLALRRNYKICFRHFELNCKGPQGSLNFGAIPTLQLGHDAEDNYANEAVTDNFNCSITDCGRSTLNDGVKLFEFPTEDGALMEKWCHNLQLKQGDCKLLKICNLHFEDGWVGKHKLVVGAVPTLLLGHNDQTLQLQEPESALKASAINTPVVKCCVTNCGRSRLNDDVHMISFPKSNSMYYKWLHNLKFKPESKLRHTAKVCSAHFEDYCKVAYRIRLGAIPTLHLGHTDVEIYQNNIKILKGDAEATVTLCSLMDCHGFKQLQIQLFDVPNNMQTRQHWCKAGLQVALLPNNAKLCALHFMRGYESQSHSRPSFSAGDVNENKHLTEIYQNIRNSSRWRMLWCSVNGCQSNIINNEGIKLFKVPQNAETYAKWCHNIGVKVDEIRRYLLRVCSLHFEARCLGTSRLRPWALPTLELNNEGNLEIYQNPEQEAEDDQDKEHCCVVNCTSSNTESEQKLWRFPHNALNVQRWCHNLGMDFAGSKERQICSIHFEAYCFGKQKLQTWAIPTLSLGTDEKNLYENPAVQDLPASSQSQICCVSDCRQQRDDDVGIRLYKFPKNPDVLQKWLNNLHLTVTESKNLRICNLHFEQPCCRTAHLAGWALPTLNLGHDDLDSIIKNPKIKQHWKKCCLTHCRKSRRTDAAVRLHRFPTAEDVRQKWLYNLRLTNEQFEVQSSSKRKLCSAHFEKACFFGHGLRNWALPTLNLGHAESIFENPQQQQQQDETQDADDLQQCCVLSCSSVTNYRNLIGFPQCVDLLGKWCDNLKFEDTAKYLRTKCRLCAKHFEPKALYNNTYLPGVVPTLYLGHDEIPQHRNPRDLDKYHFCSLERVCPQPDSSETAPLLKLFACPKSNGSLWQKWCANLRLDAAQESDFSRLCSAHFVPEVVVDNKLKPGAVPTRNLGYAFPPSYTNPPETLTFDSAFLCVALNCEQAGGKLFDFPTESVLLAKWCANLKLEPQQCMHRKICSLHFSINDIANCEALPPGALPTLQLGHIEQPAYDSSSLSSTKRHRGVEKCCVSSCPHAQTQHNSGVQLYRFPKINWLLRKWCYNLRMEATGDADNLRICAEHFEPDCLGQAKLKAWALPTLALGHEHHIYTSVKLHKYHPEEKACGEMRFVRSEYCAIISCLKSKEDDVQLFRYPRKGSLLRKWAENCKHNAYQAARYGFRICSSHFDEHCLASAGMRLRVGAIPTLQLGHNDENIHYHGLEALLSCATPTTVTDLELECSVPGCGRTKLSDNVRLFPFPKDNEILPTWCHNLRLTPEECTMAHMRICNLHFEERCFGARNLRPRMRALPTLHLGYTDTADIIPNPVTFERPEPIVSCCVPQCGKSKQLDNVCLHSFPKNRKIFDQWMHNLKLALKPSAEVLTYYRVCNEHFEGYCYGPGRRLFFGSLPTLKLGHSDVDSIHQIRPDMLSTTPYEPKKRKKLAAKLDEKCCIPDCRRTSREINVYSMPKHPKIQSMWLETLEMEATAAAKLCMLHFKIAYDKNYEQILQLNPTTEDDPNDALALELKELAAIYYEVSNSTRIRGMQCSVPACNRNTFHGEIKLYTFPYNRDLYEKWSHNTQIEVGEHQRYLYKVCTAHFEPHAIIEPSKRLRPWALPTLNLPPHTPPSTIIPNPDLATLEVRCLGHVADKLCCIPSCPNAQQATGAVFYKFPRDDVQLFHMWLYNTQLKSNDGVYARICGRHFEPHCISKRLRSWAIPTLHLGHNKLDIHRNPPEKLQEVIKLEDKKEVEADEWNDKTKKIDADEKPGCHTSLRRGFKFAEKYEKPPMSRRERTTNIEVEQLDKQIKKFDLVPKRENFKARTYRKGIETSELEESIDDLDQLVKNCVENSSFAGTSLHNEWQQFEEKIKPGSHENSDCDNMNKFEITLIEEEDQILCSNYENINYSDMEKTSTPKEGAQYCRIEDCSSRMGQRNVVLHKLPNNPLLRKRWLHNSQIEFDARRPWAFKVCSRHFARTCYSGQRLIQWAVPTLHLGPKKPATIYANANGKKLKQKPEYTEDEDDDEDGSWEAESRSKAERKLQILGKPAVAPPSFNFKITSIESINADSSLTDGGSGGGSLTSSTELQQTVASANSAITKHCTSNLTCSLPTCQRRTNEDYVQLHMLPKDPLLQHKWCHNCRLSPSPHELYTTRVCSFHFEQHCFTRTRRQLKLGSIPTLHLGHEQRNIYRNARSLCESFACCVHGCGRRRLQEQARHFRFPTDKRMLAKWLFNLQMEFNAERPWIYNVCEVHFEPYCFGKAGSLLAWAVPTLNLGNKDSRDLRLNERPSVDSDAIDDDTLFMMPECSTSETDQYKLEDDSDDFIISSHLSQVGEHKELITDYFRCHVPLCGRAQINDCEVRLFSFPKDQELRQKWIFNTKINYNFGDVHSKMIKICEQHFERSVLGLNNDVLKKFAVPTLNLGHLDDNIFLNLTEEHQNLKISHISSTMEMLDSRPRIKSEPFDAAPLEGDVSMDGSLNSSTQLELTKLCCNKLRCFLKHCRLRRSDGVKLFRFPRKTEQQLQWEHNLKLDYDPHRRQRHFLCSRHFEPELIGRKFLLRGAVPTRNLGHHDIATLYRPPAPSVEPSVSPANMNVQTYTRQKQKQQQLMDCSVPGCRSEDVLLFPLPQERKFAKIWQQNLRLDPSQGEHHRVCSVHFKPHYMIRRNLAPHAVPTLHLPTAASSTQRSQREPKPPAAPSVSASATKSSTCSVPGCPHANSYVDNIKIFTKFPDDFELFTKWCFNLKIDPRKYVDGSYGVCSAHFEAYCIGGHSLRVWAVPTLNLGHSDTNIHEVMRPAEMEVKCCLPHCGRRSSTDGVKFYNFPKGDLYKTWCSILQIDEVLYRNTDKKICSAHFTANSFNGMSLRAGVKPSLHLTAKANKKAAIKTCSTTSASGGHHSSEAAQSLGCIVLNCLTSIHDTSTSSSGQPLLFAFPDNSNLCKKWLHNLKLLPQPSNCVYKICVKHFEPNCINNGKLHAAAVPTLALGHEDNNIFTNTGSFTTATETTTSAEVNDNNLLSTTSSSSAETIANTLIRTPTDCSDIQLMNHHPHEFNDFSATFVKQEPLEDDSTVAADFTGDEVLMIGDLLNRMLEEECDEGRL